MDWSNRVIGVVGDLLMGGRQKGLGRRQGRRRGEALGWAAGIEEALQNHLSGDAIPALTALLVGEAGLDQDGFRRSGGKAFIPKDNWQSCDVG
jgi:hypothetical protein